MATILTSENHGYVKTAKGRKGECGCHMCKSISSWRKIWRKIDRAKAAEQFRREIREKN